MKLPGGLEALVPKINALGCSGSHYCQVRLPSSHSCLPRGSRPSDMTDLKSSSALPDASSKHAAPALLPLAPLRFQFIQSPPTTGDSCRLVGNCQHIVSNCHFNIESSGIFNAINSRFEVLSVSLTPFQHAPPVRSFCGERVARGQAHDGPRELQPRRQCRPRVEG